MMYNRLRLSKGGGLSGITEKVAQTENAVTIAIGIGGTGFSALRTFKEAVYERVMPDNCDRLDTEAPVYKRIKFLYIDSDSTNVSSRNPAHDFSQDFLHIGVHNITDELGDPNLLEYKPYLSWLNTKIANYIDNASYGAGGIRQVGRYLITRQANALYNRLKQMITNAITGLDAGFEINIYVMAGLGGGTGSGCFIDTCYIIRQVLDDLGCAASANLLGFFMLPDVNFANPYFPLGSPCEFMVKNNGYAALKELDYLMNIPSNGDIFEQEYDGGFKVKQDVPPVKMCYLFSAIGPDGEVIDDGYNYVMKVISEYLLNLVVSAENADYFSDNALSLKVIQANISNLVDNTHKDYGVNYCYHTLGAACAAVPYGKMAAYLGVKLFDSVKYFGTTLPDKAAVESVCKYIDIDFDELDKSLRRGTKALKLNPDNFDASVLAGVSVGEISAPLADYCDYNVSDFTDRVTANLNSLCRGLDDYGSDHIPDSIIGRIFERIKRYVMDANEGPYYAAYMLKNTQQDSVYSVLEDIKKTAKSKLYDASVQRNNDFEEEKDALAALKAATPHNQKSKKADYVAAVEKRYNAMTEYWFYHQFIDMINTIENQIDTLESEYFKKLTDVLDNLFETFADNKAFFDAHGTYNDYYTESIVDFESVKGSLDAEVAEFTEKAGAADSLMTAFVNNYDAWKDGDENKIAELISRLIKGLFDKILNKPFIEFLGDKFTGDEKALINGISGMIGKLYEQIEPLFCSKSVITDLNTINSSHAKYILLTLPQNETNVRAAAAQSREQIYYYMSIAGNAFKDRICIFKFFSGIPVCAYHNIDLYENIYLSAQTAGRHLYEEKGGRDWNKLPSPIAAAYEPADRAESVKAEIEEAFAVYDKALDYKIIRENTDKLNAAVYELPAVDFNKVFEGVLNENAVAQLERIAKLSPEKREEELKLLNWRITRTNTGTAVNRIKNLLGSYSEVMTETKYLLEASNRSERAGRFTNGFDASIRDNFVIKPVIIGKVKAEIEKVENLITVSELLKVIYMN